MVFCADLLQNPDRPLFQLFVSGDFAVCENHRDDQIDTEVIQHHIAEPFHTASRRLPETVMSRPVFRSGGRKDLPDVALRFAIDQTGEKKLAGNQQRGQFGNTQHRFLIGTSRAKVPCVAVHRNDPETPAQMFEFVSQFIGIVVRRLRLQQSGRTQQQGFGRRDGLPHPTDLRKRYRSRQSLIGFAVGPGPDRPEQRNVKRFVPVVIRLPVTLQKLVVFTLETLAGQFRKQVVPLYHRHSGQQGAAPV